MVGNILQAAFKNALKTAFLLFLIFSGSCGSGLFAQRATISENKEIFRTYPFGDPSPVANIGRIYPYFRFDGYSAEGVKQEWKVITLENPYIKVMVAPEIGGKVLGAFEKSTGKAFIYYNNVIKFRDIGMRGPWTSGGIEHNFGSIGHTPATASPVDYLMRENEDGSVSCFVGTMDVTSRTEWRMEIRVPADKAYFETRGLWYNPTALNTSQYQWMNGAADASNDLRFYHPGQHYIDHGGNAFLWHIDEKGRDIAAYGNNNFGPSKSYHVLGTYTGHFGGYYKNSDFGFGHWSLYEDKPGKKIWLWALSRSGAIWEDLLTDKDLGNTQYVEIQTGLLLNQEGESSALTPFKHLFFPPASELRFEEFWFPVKGIGGIAAANLCGSLNVAREGGNLKIGLCPLEAIDDDLRVEAGGKLFLERHLRLQPMEVFLETIPGVPEANVSVILGDRKLCYSGSEEPEKNLSRPVTANKEFDWQSVAGLSTDGVERAKQRDFAGALEKFRAALAKDPIYSPALVGAAEVYFRRMEYDLALSCVMKALANDTYDPDANFIYGIVSRQLGKMYDAKDGFGFAAKSMKYRSAANAQLAEIFFEENDFKLAEEFSQRSLAYDIYNLNALKIQALAFRKEGRTVAAGDVLERILAIDPLNHFAGFERYLLSGQSRDLELFKSMIRTELPHETYLELAIGYYNLNLREEAIKALEQAKPQPIVSLWLAYLYEQARNPAESEDRLLQAISASPFLVYPFRPETLPVLEWAGNKAGSWKTDYYQALIYWSAGRNDVAERLFRKCGETPDYAPFYITRASFFKDVDPDAAGDSYLKALSLNPEEWRAYHLLSVYYNERGMYSHSLDYAEQGVNKFPRNYVLGFDRAVALLHNGDYRGCLNILKDIVILPYEGAQYGHDTYRSACVMHALEKLKDGDFREARALADKARLWPENLGVGKPYDADERIEDFICGISEIKSGNPAGAEPFFRNITAYTETVDNDPGSSFYLYVLSLKKLGMEGPARAAIEGWLHKMPESVPARWAQAHFGGNSELAQNLLREAKTQQGGTPWNLAGGDPAFRLITEIAEIAE